MITGPVDTAEGLLERLQIQYGRKMSDAVTPEASIDYVQYESEWAPGKIYQSMGTRRIDALIMFGDGRRWAVEIKCSLSDLKSELANPDKRAPWEEVTHSFYFLVAPKLLEYALANVPKECGVMSCLEGGYWLKTHRRAKKRQDPKDLPYVTVRRMAKKLGHQHEKIKQQQKLLETHVTDKNLREQQLLARIAELREELAAKRPVDDEF